MISMKSGLLLAGASVVMMLLAGCEGEGRKIETRGAEAPLVEPVKTQKDRNAEAQQFLMEEEAKQKKIEKALSSLPTTELAFENMEHDFGEIEQNTDNYYTFTFKNAGDEALLIQDAKGSCGCTVPTYPEEPVMPGETGEIKVKYSPGSQKGQQKKTVTIIANTEPSSTELAITATVNEVAD